MAGVDRSIAPGGYCIGTITTEPVSVLENDYFELKVRQASGGSLNFINAGTFFSMQIVE